METKRAPVNHLQFADKIEKQPVRRPHTDEETQELRRELADHSIKLDEVNAEFEGVKKDWKVKIDNQKSSVDFTVQALKRGFEITLEQVYGIADHVKGTMDFYNEEGEWVSGRNLYDEEKQFALRNNLM